METKELLELLLAERVLGMATKLRSANAPENATERSEWRKQHPISEFVPIALARVREVADIIRLESLPPRLTETLYDPLDPPAPTVPGSL